MRGSAGEEGAPGGESSPASEPGRAGAAAWIAVAAVLLFVALVRVRLLDVPLERDEGEYAYAGQLILRGIPPYRLVYNMKWPGVYGAYALVLAFFGESARGIHLGLLLINAASVVLVFLLGRRLAGPLAGAAAAATYGLLSLSQGVLGPFAHATHFVVLPALAGLWLLLRAGEEGRRGWLFAAGVCLGIAVLMKQHGMFFLLFGAAWIGWSRRRAGRRLLRGGAVFAGGAALPLVLTVAILVAAGALRSLWFWTFRYAWAYVREVPPALGLANLGQALPVVIGPSFALWLLAAAGVPALFLHGGRRDRRVFLGGLLLASCLAVCPGLYFREHYFVLLLPAAALLAGLAIDALRRLLESTRWAEGAAPIAALVLLAAAVVCVVRESPLYFALPPAQASRLVYGPNPFPEAETVAARLAAETAPDDRIAVLGSEPEIFFYARRLSATGYIYMYGLMEPQPYAGTMQEQAMREIEASRPAWVVSVNVPQSWLLRPDSDRRILDWAGRYVADHCEQRGLVEILSDTETVYTWGPEAARDPRTPYFVVLYKRKAAAAPSP